MTEEEKLSLLTIEGGTVAELFDNALLEVMERGNMDRCSALKIFGALFVYLAGDTIMEDKKNSQAKGNGLQSSDVWTQIEFNEEKITQIIINRKSGKQIIVPFNDICDALET